MNRIVGGVRRANHVFRIEQILGAEPDVVHGQVHHVVNDDVIAQFVARHGQIASVVADNDEIADFFPLARAIEPLIQNAGVAERVLADRAAGAQVLVARLECREQDQLRICPNRPHGRHPRCCLAYRRAWRPSPQRIAPRFAWPIVALRSSRSVVPSVS